MVIDTHIHERQYSPDSRADIYGIVRQARAIGLDAVCITNHDDHQIKAVARELSVQLDFLIIPGCEVLTFQGDVIVFGVEQLPGKMVNAHELVEYVNSYGGVAIAAHPFRSNNRGLGKLIAEIPGLAGAEGFNGNTCLEENLLTCELAANCGLPLFGASDAHLNNRVGKYATCFDCIIQSEADFVAAVKTRQFWPVVLCPERKVYRTISREDYR
ncbi:MAG: PHP-associated domain-containing protein [Bacillota bacterium]